MKQECGRMVRCLSGLLSLVALVLLGTSVSWAQQISLKEQLTGSWTLVSDSFTRKDGTTGHAFGTEPRGILMLNASGQYARIQGRPDRPHLKTTFRSRMSAEELGEAARPFAAAFGTWSVNEADKTLTQHNQLSLVPNLEKQETTATTTLSEDELKLVSTVRLVTVVQVFRRAEHIAGARK